MILLLGASGYVGRAFSTNLQSRGLEFTAPSHAELDATSKESVARMVDAVNPAYVINAIGYTGRPNIDSTEGEKLRTLSANTVTATVLGEVLGEARVPLGHVSSGCIYDGTRADGSAFTEEDPPNFAFSHPQASWYSRTKAMAETVLADCPTATIWRLRIPFDQFDHDRNYLTKILRYENLLEVTNSISQLQEFAHACVESLERRLPAGIYNVTNPGAIRTSEVAAALRQHGQTDKEFQFFSSEKEFLQAPGRVKRASCVLSSQKLADAGIKLREVHEALDWTLKRWEERVGR